MNRDRLDNMNEGEPGWTLLTCSMCNHPFHGWKLNTKCFICAVPVFPTNVRHINRVAVKFGGKVYDLPAPHRHHHCLRLIHKEHGKSWPSIQGFLDNRGKFLTRKYALRVALHAGQVLDPKNIRGLRLYSEDLW